MKRTLMLVFIIYVMAMEVHAQDKKIASDEHFVVTDSTGLPYSYSFWKAALNSRKYSLIRQKYKKGEPPKFILHQLTEQEIDERASQLPKPKESTVFENGKSFKYFNLKDINGKK